MTKSLAITIAAAALILLAAFATLAVLTAVAGQQSGLEKSTASHCAKLSLAAAHAIMDRDHDQRPAALVGCTTP